MGITDPDRSPVEQYLDRLRVAHEAIRDGAVATYIPELGKADPHWFAICVATVDGEVYATGDADREFTVQSISKPFVYGMALDDRGPDAVLERVGVEPTGDPFNSIEVDDASNRPYNPMVNAGAIVTTGLVRGNDPSRRWARIASGFAALTGHAMAVDEAVYASERATGDRNRAIAYLMRNFGMLDGDVDEALDLYFRQCSLLVTCRDLAVAAATLAAGGRNPVTGQYALSRANVAHVLSVMQTCGMYDFAGSWTFDVGLPAKSGVSGGLIAVLPGQLGIGVFSPPLDERGNSVRGIEVCRRLVRDFELHPFRAHHASGTTVVGRRYTGHDLRSTRIRTPAECHELEGQGDRLRVLELQGRLYFADAERLLREVLTRDGAPDTLVLEGHRLAGVDPPAVPLLHGLARALRDAGVALALAAFPAEDDTGRPLVLDADRFDDLDGALERWEERTLAGTSAARGPAEVPLAAQDLLRGLPGDAIAAIEVRGERRECPAGTVLAREGDAPDAVFFVMSGRVSVRLAIEGIRGGRRLASFGGGVAVGELALLDSSPRSADLIVEEDSVVVVLAVAHVDDLDAEFPGAKATLFANVARSLSDRLRRANGRIRALEQ